MESGANLVDTYIRYDEIQLVFIFLPYYEWPAFINRSKKLVELILQAPGAIVARIILR